ncbi:inward rectifier potassium channel [Anaeramoeba ignava]|uniref:Inward rectifier potassium channel n=1 Tax=Anaeramoeba ignava TaxID=1746090 RepID=A0A9Q0RCZ7_ANAIG|nr:inward rectifier potassium channel [Anaeramoeba ignava]
MISILFFGLLYYFDIKCLRNEKLMVSFAECFYLSIQTNYHIGFGDLNPGSCTWACIVMVFQKFGRGSSRGRSLLWSRSLVLSSTENNKSQLIGRIVDRRKFPLINSIMKLYLLKRKSIHHEKSKNSNELTPLLDSDEDLNISNLQEAANSKSNSKLSKLSQFEVTELKCCFINSSPKISFIPIHFSHVIDEESPLWKKVERYQKKRQTQIICVLEGFDAITGSLFQTRKSYFFSDISFGHEFVDMIARKKGKLVANFSKINLTQVKKNFIQIGDHFENPFEKEKEKENENENENENETENENENENETETENENENEKENQNQNQNKNQKLIQIENDRDSNDEILYSKFEDSNDHQK